MLFEIAVVRSVPRVPLPSRRGVGTTAVPMDAPSERRLATLDSFPPAAHEIAGVRMTPQSRRTRRIARAIVRSRLSDGLGKLQLSRGPANEPTGNVPDGFVPNSTARRGSPPPGIFLHED